MQRYYDPQIGRFLSVDPVAAREGGDNFSRYAYANNNPYKFNDPDGRDTEVSLRAYSVRGPFEHQYLMMQDTDTGETVISRAGPSEKYPGGASDTASSAAVKSASGTGTVWLKTQMKPASKSADSTKAGAPLGKTVPGSLVTLPGGIGGAKATMQAFNQAVDAAKIDYKPLTTNSNAYAGTAYNVLTGATPPASAVIPASGLNLKPEIPDCSKGKACGGN